MSPGYAYFFGYPARHWRFAAGSLALAAMMAFVAFFCFLGAWHESNWLYWALKGAVGAGAAWGAWSFVSGIFGASIVPYFDRRLGVAETGTFGSGEEVAKQCRRLDAVAMEKGVAPLSAYGYADDVKGETLVWHDPRAGLETISALLAALRSDGPDGKLAEELGRIRAALQVAAEQGAKFCLILRSFDGTNAREHEMRKGSFF